MNGGMLPALVPRLLRYAVAAPLTLYCVEVFALSWFDADALGPLMAMAALIVFICAWEAHIRALNGDARTPAGRAFTSAFATFATIGVVVVVLTSGTYIDDIPPSDRSQDFIFQERLFHGALLEDHAAGVPLQESLRRYRLRPGPPLAFSQVLPDGTLIATGSARLPVALVMKPKITEIENGYRITWTCKGVPYEYVPYSCKKQDGSEQTDWSGN